MGQEHRAGAATQPVTDDTKRDPLLQVSFSHSTKLLPILAAVQSIPLNSAATAFSQWIQGFHGHTQQLYFNSNVKKEKQGGLFLLLVPLSKQNHPPTVLLTWGDEGILYH